MRVVLNFTGQLRQFAGCESVVGECAVDGGLFAFLEQVAAGYDAGFRGVLFDGNELRSSVLIAT